MNRRFFGTLTFAVGMGALVLAGSSVTELPPEAGVREFLMLGLVALLGAASAGVGINLLGFNDGVQ